MFIQTRREIALPVWALAVAVAAFNAPSSVIPSLVALLGLTLAGSAALAFVERLRRPCSSRIDVLPPLEPGRAADLGRIGSDKG